MSRAEVHDGRKGMPFPKEPENPYNPEVPPAQRPWILPVNPKEKPLSPIINPWNPGEMPEKQVEKPEREEPVPA